MATKKGPFPVSPGPAYSSGDIWNVYVKRIYFNFLHLRLYRNQTEEFELSRAIADVLPFVDDSIFQVLMDEFGWRGWLPAGVFCGISRNRSWLEHIGEQLVQSRGQYAGPGLAFAMIRFGSEGTPYLRAYLEKWLPRTDCHYDQKWVLAALSVSDEINGTSFSAEFIQPGGLWDKFNCGRYTSEDLARFMNLFRRADAFAELVLSLPPGKKRPPIRKMVSFPTRLVFKGQALIVKLLYRLGIDGQSRFFPKLHRFARRYPVGYFLEPYEEWVKGGARKATWWEK